MLSLVEAHQPLELERNTIQDIAKMVGKVRYNCVEELRLSNCVRKFLETSAPEDGLSTRALNALRRICNFVNILPKSCSLEGALILNDDRPVIWTDVSDTYEGTYMSKKVSIKMIRISCPADFPGPKVRSRAHGQYGTFTRRFQVYHGKVLLRKHLRHPNIVSFLGVSDMFLVCWISQWMSNGVLAEYLKVDPQPDRRRLVS